MIEKICGNCRFAQPLKDLGDFSCRRESAFLLHTRMGDAWDRQRQLRGCWPIVDANDWCGEFEMES